MSGNYVYPSGAVFPIPDSGNLGLIVDMNISGVGDVTSWSHFYDYSQNPEFNNGSGINFPFPSPSGQDFLGSGEKYTREWWMSSGVFRTYGSDVRLDLINKDESGIFHFQSSE